MARRLRARITPIGVLVMILVVSFVGRAAWLGAPCRAPCRTSADHLLVFDESYYVNAARVIAGIRPPPGARYAGAPLGDDPNAEHPQLAKLIVAGSIELFGDGPWAWRLGSLILGTVAILGMYALTRAAGGGPWLAVGAAALMALDNLLLVHGRIFTLDIYALAAMIWAAVLYLRGHPLSAGLLVGIGACCKLVAPYALLVLAVFELIRAAAQPGPTGVRRWARWRGLLPGIAGRLARLVGAAVVVFAGLLALMDQIAPPYDDAARHRVASGLLDHFGHMLSYAAHQTSPHGPTGIASYPWQWLVDFRPIVYLNINPARPGAQFAGVHPAVHFLGLISPPLMLLALPALVYAAWRWRDGGVNALAGSWLVGTLGPFVVLSLFFERTSYLYYMVVVMPAIYLAVASFVAAGWRRTGRWAPRRRQLILVWIGALVCAAVVSYPLMPLP